MKKKTTSQKKTLTTASSIKVDEGHNNFESAKVVFEDAISTGAAFELISSSGESFERKLQAEVNFVYIGLIGDSTTHYFIA